MVIKSLVMDKFCLRLLDTMWGNIQQAVRQMRPEFKEVTTTRDKKLEIAFKSQAGLNHRVCLWRKRNGDPRHWVSQA